MPNIELTVTEDSPIELSVLSDSPVLLGVQEQINATYTEPSPELKQALLQLAEHIAYIDEDGQDYYDALYNALYPPTELDYITAVYTQSGTVYDTDTLDSLKTDLVVTAHNSDGTSETVTTYTLSGTLTDGTSTITVSYGGKTVEFNVTVKLDQETVFGTFIDGHALAKNSTNKYVYVNSTASRACPSVPVENNGYTFTVTDSSKYNILCQEVTSLTEIPIPTYTSSVYKVAYQGNNKSVSWGASDSCTASYAWVALKKNDGTAFTADELAHGAEAVFTYTQS